MKNNLSRIMFGIGFFYIQFMGVGCEKQDFASLSCKNTMSR